jgi:hypothetical protein
VDRIERLDQIIVEARGAKLCYRTLDRLHKAQIERMQNRGMTRARTTTYNANAAWAAERARHHEQRLRKLIGPPTPETVA